MRVPQFGGVYSLDFRRNAQPVTITNAGPEFEDALKKAITERFPGTTEMGFLYDFLDRSLGYAVTNDNNGDDLTRTLNGTLPADATPTPLFVGLNADGQLESDNPVSVIIDVEEAPKKKNRRWFARA